MKKKLYGLDVWDLGQIELLFWGYFSFALVGLLWELFYVSSVLSAIVWLAAMLIFFRFFFNVRQNLQYSYWSFAVAFLLYLLFSFNGAIEAGHLLPLSLCYLLGITLLCLDMYFLFSPIYYPLIRWWEYDFRYRDDLKIKILLNEEEVEGRLTDLRRGAGCVLLFGKHRHGALLTIKLEGRADMEPIRGEIVSRRQYSLGRPYTYGVRVFFNSYKEKQNYYNLVKYWKSRKRLMKRLKYISESS